MSGSVGAKHARTRAHAHTHKRKWIRKYVYRPIFEVGQYVELCSFCTFASNHITVNTRDLCCTYISTSTYLLT
jgi:hypothetical protein